MGDVAPVRKWDPWKTLDVTPSELKSLQERQARRTQLKAQYQRLLADPHAGGGQGGHIFDPALQRFMSTRVSGFELGFRFTQATTKTLFAWLIIPFGLSFYVVHEGKKRQEARFRRGEVSPRDRVNIFV